VSVSPNLKRIVGTAKIAYKVAQIRCFNRKIPIFGSVDITDSCNLQCKHCYWWVNRKPHEELSPEEWRNIVREKLIEKDILSIS